MEYSKIDIKDLACFVCELLKNNGVEAILVGGACVSIYSENRYQSFDLDFVTYSEVKRVEKILDKIGFKRTGRIFSHANCPFIIDFVNPPVAIGNESIHNFNTINTSTGTLQLLTATDCVKDRLVSFIHWNDQQALEQAVLVAKDCQIDIDDVEKWTIKENQHQKFDLFIMKLQSAKNKEQL